MPRDTRVDEFEGAIRSVCEPIFDRPLKEIYFGKLLLRLFEVSRRFRMQVQPQLVLLQKTLLQVEGLGPPARPRPRPAPHRAADPRALDEGAGRARALSLRQLREEAPLWARTLPQLPRLVHRALAEDSTRRLEAALERVADTQARQTRVLAALVLVLAVLALLYVFR